MQSSNISTAENGTYTYSLVESKPAIKQDQQSTAKGKERATSSRIDLRYTGSSSSVKQDDSAGEKTESNNVRRRVKNMFNNKNKSTIYLSEKDHDAGDHGVNMPDTKEEVNSESANCSTPSADSNATKQSEDAPPTYSETVNEYLLDPMQQFSAFPPVTLRKAQIEFRQSLKLATSLLSEQQKFGGMSTAASEVMRKV